MKNSISKIVLSVLALVMVISVSYAFVAHSSAKKAPKALTNWYFTGSSTEIQDATKWTTTDPNNPDCGPSGSVPCEVPVDADNSTELQSYLNSHTTAQILDAAVALRPE